MMGKYNPFKLLYRKFGLKKIIITVVSVFVILFPSILAILFLIDSNKTDDTMSSDALTVVMYSPDGEELYREQGKSESYSESSLVGIFNVMRKNLTAVDKLPTGTDTSVPIDVEMISEAGTENFTYYFSFAEGGSFCEWNDNNYKVLVADSERFLASPFAEILYTNSRPPSLITLDGEEIVPVKTSWYYKNTERMYIGSTKIPVTAENVTYHITGGISMGFPEPPNICSAQIFDEDKLLFSGSLADAERLTLDSNTPLSVKIFAEWSHVDGCSFYGTVTYDFKVIIHGRAEFSVSSELIQKNGFTVLKATNIADLSRLSFTSEQLTRSPRFTLVGDTAYAVIPYAPSNEDTQVSFTITYGVSSRTFSLTVSNTDAPSGSDIASSAQHFGIDLTNVTPDFSSPIFIFGSRISPVDNGFILNQSFGEADGAYYTYKNNYECSSGIGMGVSAVSGGKVSFVGSSAAFGNYAVVDVGLGLSLIYSDLSCVDVSVGELVAVGDSLGKTGTLANNSSGFSLMLVFDGQILDPSILFQ